MAQSLRPLPSELSVHQRFQHDCRIFREFAASESPSLCVICYSHYSPRILDSHIVGAAVLERVKQAMPKDAYVNRVGHGGKWIESENPLARSNTYKLLCKSCEARASEKVESRYHGKTAVEALKAPNDIVVFGYAVFLTLKLAVLALSSDHVDATGFSATDEHWRLFDELRQALLFIFYGVGQKSARLKFHVLDLPPRIAALVKCDLPIGVWKDPATILHDFIYLNVGRCVILQFEQIWCALPT